MAASLKHSPLSLPKAAGSRAVDIALSASEDDLRTALLDEKAVTQEQALRLLYDWSYWSRPEQMPPPGDWRVWLLRPGRGFGKMLSMDTPVPVPSGWKAMGDISIGDEVFDETGKICRVVNTFDGLPQVAYRLHFSDDSTIDACSEHLWTTWTHAERKALLRSAYDAHDRFPDDWPVWISKKIPGQRKYTPAIVVKAKEILGNGESMRSIAARLGICRISLARQMGAFCRGINPQPEKHWASVGPKVRTTQEIVDTLFYGKRGDTNHSIPVCGALKMPATTLPIDPYVLGAWLGDGSSAGASITNADQEILDRIEAAGYKIGCPYGHSSGAAKIYGIGKLIDGTALHTQLRLAGLLLNKHIPKEYLRASVEQRLSLLRGLMDTDGHAGTNGTIEWCSILPELANSFAELARSLGQKAVIYCHPAKLYGKWCGYRYRVRWTPTINPFGLQRKADRVVLGGDQALRNHHRMIVSAEPIPSSPMRCLTVDSPHGLFLAGEAMIPTHNTRAGAQWVIQRAYEGKGPITLIGQSAFDTREVMIKGPSGIIPNSPPWFKPVYESSKRLLSWPNGVVAYCFSGDEPEQQKGPNVQSGWLDEWCKFRYAEETWNQFSFTLRYGDDPRVVITTTPRPLRVFKQVMDDPRTFVQGGTLYDNRANLNPDFVEDITRRFGGTRLGREMIMGELLDDTPGAIFTLRTIDEYRIRQPYLPVLRQVVVGVDPSATDYDPDNEDRHGSECGIIVAGVGGPEDHGYVLHDGSDMLSPKEWAERVVGLYYKHQANYVVAERNNGGGMVRETLHAIDDRVPVMLVWASQGKEPRAEPVSLLYEQGRIHHLGTLPDLEDQMCSFVPRDKRRQPSDRMDALVWAFKHLMLGDDRMPHYDPTRHSIPRWRRPSVG